MSGLTLDWYFHAPQCMFRSQWDVGMYICIKAAQNMFPAEHRSMARALETRRADPIEIPLKSQKYIENYRNIPLKSGLIPP